MRDSLFVVTPAWRDRLYREMERTGIAVSVLTYSDARSLVDRTLAAEATRLAFGVPYLQRRLARNDPTVQRAADVLRRSRTAKDALTTED